MRTTYALKFKDWTGAERIAKTFSNQEELIEYLINNNAVSIRSISNGDGFQVFNITEIRKSFLKKPDEHHFIANVARKMPHLQCGI